MTKLAFLGIDPGWSGSVVAIDQERKILGHIENYKNEEQFYDSWKEFRRTVLSGFSDSEILICIEKVHSNRFWGCKQNFNFGRSIAAVKAVLYTQGLIYSEVTPQAWQKELIGPPPKRAKKGIPKQKVKRDTKALAKLIASKLWPQFDKSNHTGCVDALLIAEYSLRKYLLDNLLK